VAGTNVTLTRAPSLLDELERIHHRIRERAYDLFRTSDGWSNPEDNWLNAERELFWQPAVEVCQKGGRFEVRAAVAGVDPKDLAVTVTSEDLLIKGNGAHEHRADQGTVHLCEFSRGGLFRSVHFPEPIVPENVTAECRNGLLTITAPIYQSEAPTKAVKPRSRR
jgi:HSP20 family molecular chaperone IbpA